MSYSLTHTESSHLISRFTQITARESYLLAIQPEMKIGPNRWHIMMYDYAQKMISRLQPGESVVIAWQDSLNPEEDDEKYTVSRVP